MKILNLYSGIGGNRKKWGSGHKITAVEINPDIAKIYCDFFPKDEMIIDDAHNFLLKNFKSYDFIWSSPPCQSHSVCNHFLKGQGIYRFPDMKLYEEIIFLKHFFKGIWVVENVKPYYKPLIDGQLIHRHLFWANFWITDFETENERIHSDIKSSSTIYGFNLRKYKVDNKRKLLRNMVDPKVGKHILECVLRQNKQKTLL